MNNKVIGIYSGVICHIHMHKFYSYVNTNRDTIRNRRNFNSGLIEQLETLTRGTGIKNIRKSKLQN